MAEEPHKYAEWNLRLLREFFSPASKGEEVFLQVSPRELDALGPDLGGDDGFLSAVRRGPHWCAANSEATFVVASLIRQRTQKVFRPKDYVDPGSADAIYLGRDAPTYLPHLAALVRSAAEADERGFYAHLRKALLLPADWGYAQMSDLEKAWSDLEKWTRSCDGQFGRFVYRVLGGYTHVGVPKSQSIVALSDSRQIGRVFYQAGLRPGQNLTNQNLRSVMEIAGEAAFLTSGFRQALGKMDFAEPLRVRIRALYEDWDGTVPSKSPQGTTGAAGASAPRRIEEVGLSLTLSEDGSTPWRVQWRLPAIRDSGVVLLESEGSVWSANLGDAEGSTTKYEPALGEKASRLLSLSGSQDVAFSARLEQEDSERAIELGELRISAKLLRVLVWKYDFANNQSELREDSLPLHGPAFLLAPPENAHRLKSFIEREGLTSRLLPQEGLPGGWYLACLTECSELTDEQRSTLPDGEESTRAAPRPVRLVGGRTITRGGTRFFLSYDLPVVEVDAPASSEVRAPGLELLEESNASMPTSIRRFRIRQIDSGSRSYTIEAVHHHQSVGSVKLRVAPDGGELVAAGNTFSLDNAGGPRADDLGVRGALPMEQVLGLELLPRASFVAVSAQRLGLAVTSSAIDAQRSSAVAEFLDSLARAGSMPYGLARDQISRLLAKSTDLVAPAILLMDLRSRGHLEIEVNNKGHFKRIHAVAPALYELPVVVGDAQLFGVLGSLRIQHWESLGATNDQWSAFAQPVPHGSLAAWRFVVRDSSSLETALEGIGLGLHWQPASALSQWAAPLDEVRAELMQFAGENLGLGAGIVERLNANTGLFFHMRENRADTSGQASHLFRAEDVDTGRHLVHAVSLRRDGAQARFSFVRDSRWGVWIALNSLADFAKDTLGMSDASPWPIAYSESTHTLWLPARIGLPAILERALVLCSGARPNALQVETREGESGIVVSSCPDGRPLVTVSRVYQQMAAGRWLGYTWVPRFVAERVASKLGGVLAPG